MILPSLLSNFRFGRAIKPSREGGLLGPEISEIQRVLLGLNTVAVLEELRSP